MEGRKESIFFSCTMQIYEQHMCVQLRSMFIWCISTRQSKQYLLLAQCSQRWRLWPRLSWRKWAHTDPAAPIGPVQNLQVTQSSQVYNSSTIWNKNTQILTVKNNLLWNREGSHSNLTKYLGKVHIVLNVFIFDTKQNKTTVNDKRTSLNNSRLLYMCNTWWMTRAKRWICWLNGAVAVTPFITPGHKSSALEGNRGSARCWSQVRPNGKQQVPSNWPWLSRRLHGCFHSELVNNWLAKKNEKINEFQIGDNLHFCT